MESKDLSELEAKIFAEYGQDGAIETLMGAGLLLIGLNMAGNAETVFIGLIPIFIVLLARVWRKRITFPRLGYVAFSSERRARRRRTVIILLFAGVCAMLLAVWSSNLVQESAVADPASAANLTRLFHGTVLSLIIAAVARFRRVNHLYLFAVLNLILFIVAVATHQPSGLAVAGTGIALLGFGVARTVRFLRLHPLQESAGNA